VITADLLQSVARPHTHHLVVAEQGLEQLAQLPIVSEHELDDFIRSAK
jgi:hypothetical protein